MDLTDNNWGEYRRLIIDTLERIDRELASINAKIDDRDDTRGAQIADLRIEVGMLKVKAAIGGVIGGAAVSAILSLAIGLLMRGK